MGVTYKHLDEYQLALEAFDCYINAVPKVPEAYVERAEVLHLCKGMRRQRKIATKPCVEATVWKCMLQEEPYLCELGKYDEAIEFSKNCSMMKSFVILQDISRVLR